MPIPAIRARMGSLETRATRLMDGLHSGTACPSKPHPRPLSTERRGGAPAGGISAIQQAGLRPLPPLHEVERGPGGEASEGRPSRQAKRFESSRASAPQPLMEPPRAGGLHRPDDPVEALDLGIRAAEVRRLVVHRRAELPLVVVEALSFRGKARDLRGETLDLAAQPLDLQAQILPLAAEGGHFAVGGVVALLPEEAFAGQLLVRLGEGGEVVAQSGEVAA